MRYLGVIPARAGSKRLPGKNIATCAGKPLIGWTCDAAANARCLNRVITSTDSSEIAEVSERFGVPAPFLRPAALSDDSASSLAVAQHALDWMREQRREQFDAVVFLQPTSPLRRSSHIDGACALFERTAASAVVSVCAVPVRLRPEKMMIELDNGAIERLESDAPAGSNRLWFRDGPSILITRAETLDAGELYGNDVRGYEMPWNTFVDIDDEQDLCEADSRLRNESVAL